MAKFAAVPHGRFVVEVPEGWADDSTLSFSAPTRAGLSAPMSPRQAPSFQSNFHITVELFPEGVESPVHFPEQLGENLRQAGAELEDVSSPADFSFAGRPGAIVERRVKLNNEAMRQLTAVAFLEGKSGPTNLIVATASTSEAEAAQEIPLLLEVFSRVRYA